MKCVERLDQYIYLCMCGFAVFSCINGAIADQFTGAAVVLGTLRWIQARPDIVIPGQYRRAIVAFLGVFFLLIFISDDIARSAKEYWRYTNRMIPFFIIVFFIKDKKRLCMVFFSVLMAMFLNNIYAIYEGVGFIARNDQYIRVSGINDGILELAGFLIIYLPLLFILGLEKMRKQWSKYIFWGVFVGTGALILNGTRIAWLITAIMLAIILFIYINNMKKFIVVFLLVFFSFGIVAYHVPFIYARVQSFVDVGNHSNRGHYFIMHDTINLIKDYPLLGVGLGRFQTVYNQEYISENTKMVERYVTHPHNTAMTIWAETGLIGSTAFWFMFGSFVYYSMQSWKKSRRSEDLMFLVITLGTLMQGITDYSFGLHQTMKIYFVMLAIYLNYRYFSKEDVK